MSVDKLILNPLDLNNDTFETTFNKIVENDNKIIEHVEKFGVVNHNEVFVATEGQTRFEVTEGIFETLANVLRVTVDGVLQVRGHSYEETWNNTFQFNEPLRAGQIVVAEYFEPNTKTRTVYVDSELNVNGETFTTPYTGNENLEVRGSKDLIQIATGSKFDVDRLKAKELGYADDEELYIGTGEKAVKLSSKAEIGNVAKLETQSKVIVGAVNEINKQNLINTSDVDILKKKFQDQIKNQTAESVSDAEIVEMRTSKDGTVYVTAGERLDALEDYIDTSAGVKIKEISDRFTSEIDAKITDITTGYDGTKYDHATDRLMKDFDIVHQKINDATFLEYNDINISADNSYYGLARDTVIQGNTVQNLVTETTNLEVIPSGDLVTEPKVYHSLTSAKQGNVDINIQGRTIQNLIKSTTNNEEMVYGTLSAGPSMYLTLASSKSGAVPVKLIGSTLQNLVSINRTNYSDITSGVVIQNSTIQALGNGSYNNFFLRKNDLFKPSTVYTIIVYVSENTLDSKCYITSDDIQSNSIFINEFTISPRTTGIFKKLSTTKADIATKSIALRSFVSNLATTGRITLTYMILEGDYTNENIPYFEGIKSVGEEGSINLVSCGKNLLDSAKILSKSTEVVITPIDRGIRLQSVGTSLWQTVKFLVKLKPSTNYYLSRKLIRTISSGSSVGTIEVRDNNNNGVLLVANYLSSNGGSFTTPSHGVVIVNLIVVADTLESVDINFTDIQLEEGTTITTYEPYKETRIPITLTQPLRSLPSGVKDELDLENGKIIRRIGKVVLTGSENWILTGNDTATHMSFRFKSTIVSETPNGLSVISDRFTSLSPQDVWMATNIEGIGGGTAVGDGITVRILKSRLTTQDVTGFKAWLQANPTTVYYELDTPIEESITTSSKAVSTYDGITNIFNQDSIIEPLITINSTGLKKETLLKPSTNYIVKWVANGGESTMNLSLGGAIKAVTPSTGITSITTPTTLTDSNLVLSNWGTRVKDLMVVEGSDLTMDLPYVSGIKSTSESDSNKVIVKSRGKNLFNTSNLSVSPSISGVEVGKFIFQGWGVGVTPKGGISTLLRVNTTYSVQFKARMIQKVGTTPLYGYKVGLGFYNPLTLQLFALASTGNVREVNDQDLIRLTFTTPSNLTDFVLVLYSNRYTDGTTSQHDIIEFSDIQLEEGTVSTTYEPYKESKQEFQLTEPLRSLPNGVCDEIVGNQLIRRVGKVVLNGSESWSKDQYNISPNLLTTYFRRTLANQAVSNTNASSNMFCDTMKVVGADINWSADTEGIDLSTLSTLGVRVLQSKLATQDVVGFKQWLAQNPLTVYYELATPTITTIQISPNLQTYTGVTNILSDNYLSPKIKINSSGKKYLTLLKPNTTYTVRWSAKEGDTNLGISLGGSVVKSVTKSTAITMITTPSTLTDNNLVISGWGTKVKNVMVVEGSKTIDQTPYLQGIESVGELQENGKYLVRLKSCGKNLFNPKALVDKTIAAYYEPYADGFVLTRKGLTIQAGISFRIPKGSMTMSFDLLNQLGGENLVVGLRDGLVISESSPLLNVYLPTSARRSYKVSFNNVNSDFIVFYTDFANSNLTISNIIISQVDTPYEPYQETVQEYLLDEPLRRLPNGVCDEITRDGSLIRRTRTTLIDGSGDWGGSSIENQVNTLVFQCGVIRDVKSASLALSDKFPSSTNSILDVESTLNFGGTEGKRLYFRINKIRLATQDLAGFKSWLSQNPTTVIYELQTPIVTKLPYQRPLLCLDGKTNITSTSKVKAQIITKVPSNVQAVVMRLASENNSYSNQISVLSLENEQLANKIDETNNLNINLMDDISKISEENIKLNNQVTDLEVTNQVITNQVSDLESNLTSTIIVQNEAQLDYYETSIEQEVRLLTLELGL